MPIDQTFTQPTEVPNKSEPATFNTRIKNFLLWLVALIPELTTWTQQANTVHTEINDSQADVVTKHDAIANPTTGMYPEIVTKHTEIADPTTGFHKQVSDLTNTVTTLADQVALDAAEVVLHNPIVRRAPTTSGVMQSGVVSLTYEATAEDVTTTTAAYALTDYVYDTSTGILYDCIQASTIGTLLTNALYFTAVTSNTATLTNAVFSIPIGEDGAGSLQNYETFTGNIPLGVLLGSGKRWVYYISGGTFGAVNLKPNYGLYEKEFADDNRLVFQDGVYRETVGGELLVDGTGNWLGDFNQADGALVAPYDAWTFLGDTVGTIASGVLNIDSGATSLGVEDLGELSFSTPDVGEELKMVLTFTDTAFNMGFDVRASDGAILYSLLSSNQGTKQLTIYFTPTTIVSKFVITNATTQINRIIQFDDISIFKSKPTVDAILPNISFIKNPFIAASDIPQYIDLKDALLKNVTGDLVVLSDAEFKGGVDFGLKDINLLADRAYDITYKNETRVAIWLSITASVTASGNSMSLYINGEQASQVQNGATIAISLSIQYLIQPNDTYKLTNTGVGAISIWRETERIKG